MPSERASHPQNNDLVNDDPVNNDLVRENRRAELLSLLQSGADYGKNETGRGQRVLVEFVSAPPNVPLSLTHGRGGVVGDMLAALFSANGYEVQREFYVNDAADARPNRAFVRAVLARYRERCGIADDTPDLDSVSREYVGEIAGRIYASEGDAYASATTTEAVPIFRQLAQRETQNDQRSILDAMGIRFDRWFLESEHSAQGAVDETLGALIQSGHAEKRGDAIWLRSAGAKDEPHDHVLRRADGAATYLAGDLAYHRDKFARGYDRLIDIWSADHAAYVTRTRAGLRGMGFDPAQLDVVLFQRVRALRDGTEVKGDSATGVPLADWIAEAGADALRFHLGLVAPDRPLDLDMDSARDAKGPLGRVCAAATRARQASEDDALTANIAGGNISDLSLESLPTGARANTLWETLMEFPDVVREAAQNLSPQRVGQFALRLTDAFDAAHYLSHTRTNPTLAEKALCRAVAQTLENALVLIGVYPGTVVAVS